MLLPNNLLCLIVLALFTELSAYNRVKRKELDPQTCVDNFDIQRNKIIRTEESREMGAKYLNEMDVGSREDCHRLCCETETCDVFIFEEKIQGSCYLFHCGPPEDFRCKFTRHENFTSGVLTLSRTLAELEDQARLTKHVQDLTRLRRPKPESVTGPKTTNMPTRQKSATAKPFHEVRRCSRYQFECHSGDECIAIYNACDGIAQCTDSSDEAPELGCPSQTSTGIRASTTSAPHEILSEQKYNAKIHSEPVIFSQPVQEQMNWPNKPDTPIITEESGSISSPHIFNHKNSLLTNTDTAQIPQYVPYVPVQDNQWGRRQWPMSMEYESRMMQHYPAQEWKQQLQMPYQNFQSQPQMPIENPVVQMEPVENVIPESSHDNSQMPVMGAVPSRNKMWIVPQVPAQTPVQTVYQTSKTMPETPIIYSNQQGTLRDSAKKGFDLKAPKLETASVHQDRVQATTTNLPSAVVEAVKPTQKVVSKTVTEKQNLVKESNNDSGVQTGEKELTAEKAVPVKQNIKPEFFQTAEDNVDEGFSDKPPGAIFLLILGILMTTVMATMLVCRIRVMRWRVRARGGAKAYDADYLVNGMYL